MDESYRSRHRAEWERRRAAEQQAEATRRVETSGSAQSPPKDSSAQPATAGNAQIQQGQGTACPNTVNSSASSWPQAGWDGSQVALRSLGGMSQLACDASVPTACPNIDPDEVASLETARRLQAEFESVNEVRAPDVAYRERLLGGHETYWNPTDAPPDYWLSQQFPVDDGTRNTEEQLDDEEIARRLQETENRRASRLQQPLPRLRSESPQTDSHMQGSEAHVGQLPPRDLQVSYFSM